MALLTFATTLLVVVAVFGLVADSDAILVGVAIVLGVVSTLGIAHGRRRRRERLDSTEGEGMPQG